MQDTLQEIGQDSNPIAVFEEWMAAAKAVPSIREPTAMNVATVAGGGEIHSRVVLCKKWSEEGFVFYSNYQSRKGLDLAANAQTALLFYFDPMFRQIKISGVAEKTSRQDSEDYWRSRARGSQLSQYISNQSQPIASRQELQDQWNAAEAKFKDCDIPCPEHWGGYLVRPRLIEFWIGHTNRLHDTFEFEKDPAGWTFRRLSP